MAGTQENNHKSGNPPSEQDYEAKEKRARLREKVDLVLSDGLMIGLALLMVPTTILPLLFTLSASVEGFLNFVDYAILAIFVVEYVLKAGLAESLKKHVTDPWRILDLIVIVLPVFDFLPMMFASQEFARSSPLLRLLRIARVAAISGRSVERRMMAASEKKDTSKDATVVKIRVMEKGFGNVRDDVEIKDIRNHLRNNTETWIDIAPVSHHYFAELSEALGIPQILLESKLVEEAYPRIDYFEKFSTIYVRTGDVTVSHYGTNRITVERAGLLIICAGKNIITISKRETKLAEKIIGKAKKYNESTGELSASILYGILKYILDMDEHIIGTLEHELLRLENIPHDELPSNFLETTFHLKKEVNQLVSSLLHLKEMISVINTKRVPLEGFDEDDQKIFSVLLDDAEYLYDTAQNARENLISLIELYINTNAHETNQVMRVIAVITCLAIIPAIVGGLFGMNLIDNPWNFMLWQVAAVVGAAMFGTAWIFFKMGWLKG